MCHVNFSPIFQIYCFLKNPSASEFNDKDATMTANKDDKKMRASDCLFVFDESGFCSQKSAIYTCRNDDRSNSMTNFCPAKLNLVTRQRSHPTWFSSVNSQKRSQNLTSTKDFWQMHSFTFGLKVSVQKFKCLAHVNRCCKKNSHKSTKVPWKTSHWLDRTRIVRTHSWTHLNASSSNISRYKTAPSLNLKDIPPSTTTQPSHMRDFAEILKRRIPEMSHGVSSCCHGAQNINNELEVYSHTYFWQNPLVFTTWNIPATSNCKLVKERTNFLPGVKEFFIANLSFTLAEELLGKTNFAEHSWRVLSKSFWGVSTHHVALDLARYRPSSMLVDQIVVGCWTSSWWHPRSLGFYTPLCTFPSRELQSTKQKWQNIFQRNLPTKENSRISEPLTELQYVWHALARNVIDVEMPAGWASSSANCHPRALLFHPHRLVHRHLVKGHSVSETTSHAFQNL